MLAIVCTITQAQITYISDTTFTNHSAFIKAIKQWPEIRLATASNHANVTQQLNITYANRNGFDLKLDVYRLKQYKNKLRPVVVIIHGGGWRSGSKEQEAAISKALAGAGYVCINVNYTLSTHAHFPAAVHDIKNAIKWIKQNSLSLPIDTAKIAVLGCSAGGQLAALIGNTNHNKAYEDTTYLPLHSSSVAAIIDIDGTLSFVHPESGESNEQPNRPSSATLWLGATKAENFDIWVMASPLSQVHSKTPPTLFINSSVARMHAGRDEYVKLMNQYGNYTAIQTFENSPHTFWLFHPWFNPMIKQITTFLNKAL